MPFASAGGIRRVFEAKTISLYIPDVKLIGSYTTGGDPLPTGRFAGWSHQPEALILTCRGTKGYRFAWNKSTDVPKLFCFVLSTGAELAAGAYPAAILADTHMIWVTTAKG